uniref:Tubulin polyglutamylase TTLL4 n=1 Tax=Chinchilla lanigera TaxID=34839 RepID=A0A8C2W7B2_CHILA
MASGGEEPNNPGHGCRNNDEQPGASGLVPAPPPEKPSESRARSQAHRRVRPVWKLEKKYAGPELVRVRPGLLKVSTQAAHYSYTSSLGSSGNTGIVAGRNNSTRLGSLPGLFSSTVLYHPSHNTHRPHRHTESSVLHSSPSEKRAFSVPQKKFPVSLNDNEATSSTVFPLAASTNPYLSLEASERKPPRKNLAPATTGKMPSPLSLPKPVLNSNIFMKPNIIKVPCSGAKEALKPVSTPKTRRVFLHGLGVTPNYAPQGINYKVSKSICTVVDAAAAHITLPTPSSFNASTVSGAPSQYNPNNLGTRAEPRSYKLNDDSSSQVLPKAPQFTEAARRFAAKDTDKKPQQEYHLGQSYFGNSDFQGSLLSRRRWKPPLLVQHISQKYAGPDRKILPGTLDTTGLESVAHSIKKSSILPVASHANRLSSSLACGSIIAPLPAGKDKAPIPPIPSSSLQPAGRAEVTTRLASIHPGRLEKEEPEDSPAIELTNDCQPDHTEADDAEEQIDEMEDSSSHDEDENEEDECLPLNAASPKKLVAAISQSCMETRAKDLSNAEGVLRPALTPSLFVNVPPTIYFGTQNERVEKLPWQQRKLLRWKMSGVTPNIVKQTIERSHFLISKTNGDWLGCWDRHMKCTGFRAIRDHQKFNHFPGSSQIGRKDQLWTNLSRMQSLFGKKEFDFFPESFILPQDLKLLHKVWESNACQKWIVKPPASARGAGIQVIHKWSQLPKRRPLLVQTYLHKPYLINGTKFDLRIYVYVTSYDPLRIYLFSDGLVRFASCKYSTSAKNLGNKFMHLTNYSVNKMNAEYQANADEMACQGHKWALKALWKYLNQKGIRSSTIWKQIKDIVVKTIISSEPYVTNLLKMYVRRPYCCHELFGFDIFLDENLKPWVLEVNISPSLHSNSPLDVSIKGQMIRDLLNLAGFVLPNTEDISSTSCTSSSLPYGLSSCPTDTCPVASGHFASQKVKEAYYLAQKIPDQNIYSSVLDVLTPDDIRILVEMEDEFSRRGQFERIFPSHNSFRYLRFFEEPRYSNILTIQWEQKYHNNRAKGLDLLRNWCTTGCHVEAISDSAPGWRKSAPIPNGPRSDEILNTLSTPDSGELEKTTVAEESEDASKEPNPSI